MSPGITTDLRAISQSSLEAFRSSSLSVRTCCSIALSPSTVSHHFKELQNAGLITTSRNGQTFLCTVNADALAAIAEFAQSVLKS